MRGPVATLWWTSWGPDQPWVHRDLLGALWLWHAAGHGGTEAWLALQNVPDGAPGLRHHIPNPFDGWLVGPLVAWVGGPLRSWWAVGQLAHHLGNVAATVWLARAVGLKPRSSAVAGLMVAATPVMLHEVAGGRGLSGAVWPGLLALGFVFRGNGLLAGVLVGIQALCYLYTGVLVGVLAVLVRPRAAVAVALGSAVLVGPYLAWLSPLLSGLSGRPPPADFSVLPVAGIWGGDVPARQRWSGVLLLGLLALGRRRHRGLAAAGLVALLVALGPTPGAKTDAAVVASPLAWLVWAVPAFGRMHHPVRAVLLATPLLAVALVGRVPRLGGPALLVVWLGAGAVQEAAAWGEARPRPGMGAAMWLADQDDDGAVLDLTGSGDAALGLQLVHGRGMVEGLRRPIGAGPSAALRTAADGWLRGERQPGLGAQLAAAGVGYVLVVGRRAPVSDDVWAVLVADLGEPVYPGVFATAPLE